MKKVLFCLALIGMLVVTGCGKKSVPEKYAKLLSDNSGSIVRLGCYGPPDSVDPIKSAEYGHDQIFSNLIFASPLRKLDDGSYVPYLFESYETKLEDDGRVLLTAQWRNGLKWHDGVEFEPSEFEFTIKQMALPSKNSPFGDVARNLVDVNCNSSCKVEMRFPSNSVKYMDMLCVGLLPGHILAEGAKLASGTPEEAYKAFLEEPVGLGPYKLVDRYKHSYFLLEPHKFFFDGNSSSRPQVLLACTYELQQSISDFREKQLDWIDMPLMVGEQLENLGVENIIYMKYPNPAVISWIFNANNPKLKDVRVRKALNLLVPRDCAKERVGVETIELFDSLEPMELPSAGDDRFVEGIKLLDEAGIKDSNNDGIREFGNQGEKLKIIVNDDSIERRKIADKIVESLVKAGIEAEVESLPWSEFVSGRLKSGNYETAMVCYHIQNNCSLKNIFSSKKPDDADSLNFTGISDEQLDEDLAKLDSIVCDEDKVEIYKRVNKKISEFVPMAFLVRTVNLALVHSEQTGKAVAKTSFWNDIFNWKLMFGNKDSKL